MHLLRKKNWYTLVSLNPFEKKMQQVFPVGARVRTQSEMWEHQPEEYGHVEAHLINKYGAPQWLRIRLDDGSYIDYDYRYLDPDNMRNSLVKVLKGEDNHDSERKLPLWYRKVGGRMEHERG